MRQQHVELPTPHCKFDAGCKKGRKHVRAVHRSWCAWDTGAFLKEAIDDLEWAASGSRGVELRMQSQPASVSLCSYGTSGDLLIDLPASEVQARP